MTRRSLPALAILSLLCPALSFAQGDECKTAIPIQSGVFTIFDTTHATPSALSWSSGGPDQSNDVWFSFTPTVSFAAIASTCNLAEFDTRVEIFDGSCGGLNLVGRNDDFEGCEELTSEARFVANAGVTYFIRVGGSTLDEKGRGDVVIEGAPITNDKAVTATVIAPGTTVYFDTTRATPSPEPSTCIRPESKDVWFEFTAQPARRYVASVCLRSTMRDTVLQISTKDGTFTEITCWDDFCERLSRAVVPDQATLTTYCVRVCGDHADCGSGLLRIIEGPLPAANTFLYRAPSGSFMDIALTGTPLSLGLDAEQDIQTSVGNSVFPSGTVRVGSNGAVRFTGSNQELLSSNDRIPSYGAFRADRTLMPFWDSIDTAGGSVLWKEIAGTLVIQWENVGFVGGSADRATFQVQVPSQGPTVARFAYKDIESTRADGGGSATIGFQSDDDSVFTSQKWSFNESRRVGNGDVLALDVGTQLGSNYCMASNNSTNDPGVMSAFGSMVVSQNHLILTASGLPKNQYGHFLTSLTQELMPGAGGPSNGNLCLGGAIGRFTGANQLMYSGLAGAFSLVVDLSSPPFGSVVAPVMSGGTWNFQAWYRDTGGVGSNYADGLEVTFN